jgi:hypothetical protein
MRQAWLIAIAIAGCAGAPALAKTPAPASPCALAQRHQFDFWIGAWDVYLPSGKLVAHSRIESAADGCVIRETWMPLKGSPGVSLSSYDAASGRWRQAWSDADGAWVLFEGAAKDGGMVLEGLWPGVLGPGKDATVRMTYSRQPKGAVRQLGETKAGKAAWTPSFDFLYRPTAIR